MGISEYNYDEIAGDYDYDETDLENIPLDSPVREAAEKAVKDTKTTHRRRRDYRGARKKSKKSWETISGKPEFPQKLQDILRRSVILPRQSFQELLILSYLMVPAIKCDQIPLMFSQGKPGCGKSLIGLLSTYLHGTSFVGSTSTATSLRNTADSIRKYNSEVSANVASNEKPCYSLAWNDVFPEMLFANDCALLTLLKLGVDRSSVITKAGAEKGNEEFWVFGPKIFSSISMLLSDPRAAELKRRTLCIEHKPSTEMSGEDWDSLNRELVKEDLIIYRNYDWDSIQDALIDYWDDDDSLDRWDETAEALDGYGKHGMERPLFEMCFDLIVCGVVCGYFSTVQEACKHWKAYWQWHKENIESKYGASLQAIRRYIARETEGQIRVNQEAAAAKLHRLVKPLEIDPASLKIYCNECASRGELDSYLDDSRRAEAMRALGWNLTENSSGEVKWLMAG